MLALRTGDGAAGGNFEMSSLVRSRLQNDNGEPQLEDDLHADEGVEGVVKALLRRRKKASDEGKGADTCKR